MGNHSLHANRELKKTQTPNTMLKMLNLISNKTQIKSYILLINQLINVLCEMRSFVCEMVRILGMRACVCTRAQD